MRAKKLRIDSVSSHLPEPIEEVEHALEILHDAEERDKHSS